MTSRFSLLVSQPVSPQPKRATDSLAESGQYHQRDLYYGPGSAKLAPYDRKEAWPINSVIPDPHGRNFSIPGTKTKPPQKKRDRKALRLFCRYASLGHGTACTVDAVEGF
jgi:hypothetical protein